MKKIDTISNQGRQSMQLILEDGSLVTLALQYVDNQRGWFYSLYQETSGLAISNRRVVASPNMLRAFRRDLDWGLACVTTDGGEPVFVDDFFTGRAALYLLDAADVEAVETLIK